MEELHTALMKFSNERQNLSHYVKYMQIKVLEIHGGVCMYN